MRIPLLIYLTCVSFACFSQIEHIDVRRPATNATAGNTVEAPANTEVYDSNRNYSAPESALIGQEIYVIPLTPEHAGSNNEVFLVKPVSEPPVWRLRDKDQFLIKKYRVYKPVVMGCGGSAFGTGPDAERRAKEEYKIKKNADAKGMTFEDFNEFFQFCNNYVTDFSAVSGRKFKITGMESGYLKIENEDNGDLVYLDDAKPCVLVLGYFEKLKMKLVDTTFVYHTHTGVARQLTDNNTGKTVSCADGDEWTCVKVALADFPNGMYQQLAVVLENKAGSKVIIRYSDFTAGFMIKTDYLAFLENERAKEQQRIAEEKRLSEERDARDKLRQEEQARIAAENRAKEKREEAERKKEAQREAEDKKKEIVAREAKKQKRLDNFVQRFGDEYGHLIADGQVRIGMTKEMCREAWGKPYDIHIDEGARSYSEQWVYDLRNYLYFNREGRLYFIQR